MLPQKYADSYANVGGFSYIRLEDASKKNWLIVPQILAKASATLANGSANFTDAHTKILANANLCKVSKSICGTSLKASSTSFTKHPPKSVTLHETLGY